MSQHYNAFSALYVYLLASMSLADSHLWNSRSGWMQPSALSAATCGTREPSAMLTGLGLNSPQVAS